MRDASVSKSLSLHSRDSGAEEEATDVSAGDVSFSSDVLLRQAPFVSTIAAMMTAAVGAHLRAELSHGEEMCMVTTGLSHARARV